MRPPGGAIGSSPARGQDLRAGVSWANPQRRVAPLADPGPSSTTVSVQATFGVARARDGPRGGRRLPVESPVIDPRGSPREIGRGHGVKVGTAAIEPSAGRLHGRKGPSPQAPMQAVEAGTTG